MNNYKRYLVPLVIFFAVLSGCKRMAKNELYSEDRHKHNPVKVETPQSMSNLFEELGFEYSTLQEAEMKIVVELDSIISSDNSNYIHYINIMHNDKLKPLLINDPRAFDYEFPLMQKRGYVSFVTSDDNKLRLFHWNTGNGGTMIDWGNLCQFKSNGDIFVYDCAIYEIEYSEPNDYSFGCAVMQLHTIKADNGETYYLAETYFREGGNIASSSIYPVKIVDGKLVPVQIFDSEGEDEDSTFREYFIANWYFKTNAGEGWDWLYRFDKDTQTLYVPEVHNMEFTDRYNLYRFNGESFNYIGDDGGFWLHPDVRDFKQLELLFCTEDYRIRIDLMADDTYRYSVWGKNASMSERPDLIIPNGTFNKEDGKYNFENNGYKYCIHSDSNDSQLTIYHLNNIILDQRQKY